MNGFEPMPQAEMSHVKGGIVPLLLIAAAAVITSGCVVQKKPTEVTHDLEDCNDSTCVAHN